MYTLEECNREWREIGRHGDIQKRLLTTQKWMPYYSYLSQKQLGSIYCKSAQAERILDYMSTNLLLDKSYFVLDIGAGTGRYAIEFAGYCAHVAALDPNRDSLAVLQDYARQKSFTNIAPILSTWEEYKDPTIYDITFSAMCNAICDMDEILRMESITRRTCCILAVMRGSYEKHRMAMMKELPVTVDGGMTTEAIYYYNTLYLMGRKPDVKCWSEHFEYQQNAEQLLEQYILYFQIFNVPPEISEPYIKKYLATHASDGILKEECQMNYALITWNVP